MTEAEKDKIRYWRGEGLSYGAIADRLHISRDTVKSFCRRNCPSGVVAADTVLVCRNCGAPLTGTGRKQPQKFCSADCRYAWWKAHRELMNRSAFYPAVCSHCGKDFVSYGNQKRKYCCHACYIAARFGERDNHDTGAV